MISVVSIFHVETVDSVLRIVPVRMPIVDNV